MVHRNFPQPFPADAVKLQLDQNPGIHMFTAYGEDYVAINRQPYHGNLILMPEEIITDWCQVDIAGFSEKEAEQLKTLPVEVILLGTGQRLRFPPPALLRLFSQARIGFEVMDLPAACRTYNILASEGRKVAAALLFDRQA